MNAPVHSFRIPAAAVPELRRRCDAPVTERGANAYFQATLEAFQTTFPNLNPTQHVCWVYSESDPPHEIAHRDLADFQSLEPRIRQLLAPDHRAMRHDLASAPFAVAQACITILRLVHSPDGQYLPQSRRLTPSQILQAAGVSPDDVWMS